MPLGEEDLEDTQVVVPPQEKRSKKSAGVPPYILELDMFFLVIRQKELYQTLENKMNIEIDRIMLAKEELKSKKMIDLLQVFQKDDHWYNQMGVKARARLRGVKPIEFAVDPVILETFHEMFNCDEPQGIHHKNPLGWYPRELLLKKSLFCFKICLAQNTEYWKALAAVLGKDGIEDDLFTFRPKFRKMCIFGSCDGSNTTLVQEYFK
ncbi:hypothetical protein WICPIJ_007779 [Wickerhamomyces pijperi]|uniref:Uncharacterized protein n=1 Tax=Wickerhamomyces pijperi TaxID=599730 RepID=A0A9P8Q154_WICPI|nr:hypothetical protein WICPIJ_007779 [Wickerhamomyces pijperi]